MTSSPPDAPAPVIGAGAVVVRVRDPSARNLRLSDAASLAPAVLSLPEELALVCACSDALTEGRAAVWEIPRHALLGALGEAADERPHPRRGGAVEERHLRRQRLLFCVSLGSGMVVSFFC